MAGLRPYLVRVIGSLAGALLVTSCATGVHGVQPYCADQECRPNARIAVVGDLQRTGPVEVWRERNDVQRERLLRQLAADGPQSVVLLGDMVWWGGSDDEWTYFDRVMRPVYDLHVPVLPVLGNHEYYGDDESAMRNVRQRFPEMRHDHDVRVIDSVAIVMLNTNFDEMSELEARAQRRWFVRVLKRLDEDPAVTHVVVAGHHPPFTNSTVVSDDRVLRRGFIPAFTRASKTALWLSGHAHTYERFLIEGKHYIVSGGGGGPRQEVRTAAEGAVHADLYGGPTIRPLHYLLLERHGTNLYCTMRPLDALRTGSQESDVVVVPSNDRQLTAKE